MWTFQLLAKLPFWVLYLLSDFLYFLSYRIIGYRKKVVRKNIKSSFPEKTEVERKKIEKQFYKNLADVVFESIKSLSISKKEILERVQINAPEVLMKPLKEGKSAFAFTGHQGNWEWLLLRWSITLVENNVGVDAVYKPLSDKFFDRLMLKVRSRFGAEPLPMQNILRTILSHKNESRVIAMVADQRPSGDEKNIWTEMLHQETPFFTGPEKLVKKTKFPAVYAGMKRLKRGHYLIEMKAIDTSQEITKQYAQMLAMQIKEQPADWLWSHDRWKHKRQTLEDKELLK